MSSFVNYIHAENNVRLYWDLVLNNQDGSKTPILEKILSPDIVVDSTFCGNSLILPNRDEGIKDVLAETSKLSKSILENGQSFVSLTLYNLDFEHDQLKLSYNFEKVTYNKSEKSDRIEKIYSRGKQFWTSTQEGSLLSLNIIEFEGAGSIPLARRSLPLFQKKQQ